MPPKSYIKRKISDPLSVVTVEEALCTRLSQHENRDFEVEDLAEEMNETYKLSAKKESLMDQKVNLAFIPDNIWGGYLRAKERVKQELYGIVCVCQSAKVEGVDKQPRKDPVEIKEPSAPEPIGKTHYYALCPLTGLEGAFILAYIKSLDPMSNPFNPDKSWIPSEVKEAIASIRFLGDGTVFFTCNVNLPLLKELLHKHSKKEMLDLEKSIEKIHLLL